MSRDSRPERPHVTMLVDSIEDGTGGAERFAAGLATALPADRFRVSLCATRHAHGELLDTLDAAGVEHLALGRERTRDVAAFAKLGRFLREERVDVLHCHKFGSNVWGSIVGRLARVPVVLAHEHTWSYEGQPLRRFLDGQVIGRLCDRFVAVSEADRRRMVSLEGVPDRKAITLPTAYIPRPADVAGDLRAELGLSPTAPTAGTIANLRPQKALGVLLEAWRLVLRDVPDARLLIVGDGPERGALEERASSLGISESVDFLGVRTDLATVFGGLDVAVLSSDFEGLPLFAFESMASSTPLVTTAVGGLPDLIVDGQTGMLVPPRDPPALAAALRRLLVDADRRAEIAAAAAELLPGFTIDAVGERFAQLYGSLLADRRHTE